MLRVATVVAIALFGASDAHGAVTNQSVIDCQPSVLRPGGAVEVRLGPQHGYEITIQRASDRVSYFLVVQSPPPEMSPLMTRRKFSRLRRLRITDGITGFPWVADAKGNERIFSHPGRYDIVVADVLESDASLNFKCAIDYVR